MRDILEDGPSCGWLIYGDVFSEEFSVPECLPY